MKTEDSIFKYSLFNNYLESSCSTIDYLRLNESLCKMSTIYFWPFLGDFGVITHVTYGSSKKFKIQ